MKKLTKSQRVYVTMLAVALVAFAVDTLFLRGEGRVQEAGAESIGSPPPPPPLTPTPSAPTPVAIPVTPVRSTNLAETLAACDTIEMDQIREAFQPSPQWLEALRPPPPEPGPSPEVTTGTSPDHSAGSPEDAQAVLRAQEFVRTHKLMSIIRTSDGGTALVDGYVVQIGGKLDGFALVRLTERGAVFEAGGVQVELRLSEE